MGIGVGGRRSGNGINHTVQVGEMKPLIQRRDFVKAVGMGTASLAIPGCLMAEELHRLLIEWREAVNAPVPTERNPLYKPDADPPKGKF